MERERIRSWSARKIKSYYYEHRERKERRNLVLHHRQGTPPRAYEERYERRRAYASKSYSPSVEDDHRHRRKRNWKSEHGVVIGREIDHGKYLSKRFPVPSRKRPTVDEWHVNESPRRKEWQRNRQSPEENWDTDDNYQPQDWKESWLKHDSIQDEYPTSPISDDLSEISDDTDEILAELQQQAAPHKEESLNDIKKEDEVNAEAEKKSTQNGTEEQVKVECAEDNDLLVFEKISDCELEEYTKSRNLDDVLGVDWASMVEEYKPRAQRRTPRTAKQRWQPHRIILDLGISVKLAGVVFTNNILEYSRARLAEEVRNIEAEPEVSLLTDTKPEGTEENPKIAEIKKEAKVVSYELPGNLACVQTGLRQKRREKRDLVHNACCYSSARRDLALRRQLCGLPVEEIGYDPPISDHLKALAIKHFEKVAHSMM